MAKGRIQKGRKSAGKNSTNASPSNKAGRQVKAPGVSTPATTPFSKLATTMVSSPAVSARDSPLSPVGSDSGKNDPSGDEDQNGGETDIQPVPKEIVTPQPGDPEIGAKINALLSSILATAEVDSSEAKAKELKSKETDSTPSTGFSANSSVLSGVSVVTTGPTATFETLGGAQVGPVAPVAPVTPVVPKSRIPIFRGKQLPLTTPKEEPSSIPLHDPSIFELGALDDVKPSPRPADVLQPEQRFNKNWPLFAKPLAPGSPRPGSQGPENPGRFVKGRVNVESSNIIPATVITTTATAGLNPNTTTAACTTSPATPILPETTSGKPLTPAVPLFDGVLTDEQKALITQMLKEEHAKLRLSNPAIALENKPEESCGVSAESPALAAQSSACYITSTTPAPVVFTTPSLAEPSAATAPIQPQQRSQDAPAQLKSTTPSKATDLSLGPTQLQSIVPASTAAAMASSVTTRASPAPAKVPTPPAVEAPPKRITNLSIGSGRPPQGPVKAMATLLDATSIFPTANPVLSTSVAPSAVIAPTPSHSVTRASSTPAPSSAAPAIIPVVAIVPPIQTAPIKPSEFDLAKAVTAFSMPAVTATGLVPTTSRDVSSSAATMPPSLSAGLSDIEVAIQKRIAALLGTSETKTPVNAVENPAPEPSSAPAQNDNPVGKYDDGAGDNGDDKKEKDETNKTLLKSTPKVTPSPASKSQAPSSRSGGSSGSILKRTTDTTTFNLVSSDSRLAAKPASRPPPKAVISPQETAQAPMIATQEESKVIQSTLSVKQVVPDTFTPLIENCKGTENAKETLSFQAYLDKQRARNTAGATSKPHALSRGGQKPSVSLTLLQSVPVAPASTPEAREKIKKTPKLLPVSVGRTQPSPSPPPQKLSPIPTLQAITLTTTKQSSTPVPRRKTQKRASNKLQHASDSSSPDAAPSLKISAPEEPFWNPKAEAQKLLEVPVAPSEPKLSPKIVAADSITAVYTKLRGRGYSPDVATKAMKYARKGSSDLDMPSVDACEAWINAGMIVPKGPEDVTLGEVTVVGEPVSASVTSMALVKSTPPASSAPPAPPAQPAPPAPPAPPARDYGLRGGPLLYEDFAELWAEEEAEEAAKAKSKAEAEKATLDEEYPNHQDIMPEEQRQPVSSEYNRRPDVGPTKVHCSTALLKYSVEYLDIQYYDLSDEERKRGKMAALPRLEMLKILAPMEGRSLDDPGVVDDYIQVLREQYEKIRGSKRLVDPVGAKPAGMKDAGDTAQGTYGGALRKGVVVGAVTGAIGGAISAAVLAGFGGLYQKLFA